MNINLEIKVDSPELMTAILRLAEALPKLLVGSFSILEGNHDMDLITPVPEVLEKGENQAEGSKDLLKEASQGKADLETIKELLKQICHREKMLEILSKYGAKKVSQLQEKDYKAIIKDLEECLCQLSAN